MRLIMGIALTLTLPSLLAVGGACIGGYMGFHWFLPDGPVGGCGNLIFAFLVLFGGGVGALVGFIGGLVLGGGLAMALIALIEPVEKDSEDGWEYYQPPP